MVRAGHRIPVTVIGGYLGAGKTTLINELLRTTHEPFAVLVNDFGSINIDAELIDSDDGTTIALSNGCICCSLVDGFGAALNEIRRLQPAPPRLLVEASGVADPQQVGAYAHAPGFTLDGVIVLADGDAIEQQLANELIGDVIGNQIKRGDLVLVTKLDLLQPAERAARIRVVADMCAAPVIEASSGQIPDTVLFGPTGPFRVEVESGPSDGSRVAVDADERFEVWEEVSDEPLVRDDLESRLATLPDDVVRCKGIVRFADSPDETHGVHVVGRRWSVTQHGRESNSPSRLVFIGLKGSAEPHR